MEAAIEYAWDGAFDYPGKVAIMSMILHADPLPLRVDETGAIRVGESRVTLDVLLQYWKTGMTPEEIARGLDILTPADVHGALAYYHRHQREVENYLRRRDEEAEQLRRQIAAANASRLAPLKARLDAARETPNGGVSSVD
jgi:uncharacterized protein (DUF433 family)